jgi:hypothetical protein
MVKLPDGKAPTEGDYHELPNRGHFQTLEFPELQNFLKKKLSPILKGGEEVEE